MANKEKNTFKESKQPKTVKVVLLVPYAIIISMALITASLITGWALRSSFDNTIKSEVKAQVRELTSKEVK